MRVVHLLLILLGISNMRDAAPLYILLPAVSGLQDKESIATASEYPWVITDTSGISFSSSATLDIVKTKYRPTDIAEITFSSSCSYDILPTIVRNTSEEFDYVCPTSGTFLSSASESLIQQIDSNSESTADQGYIAPLSGSFLSSNTSLIILQEDSNEEEATVSGLPTPLSGSFLSSTSTLQ